MNQRVAAYLNLDARCQYGRPFRSPCYPEKMVVDILIHLEASDAWAQLTDEERSEINRRFDLPNGDPRRLW